MSPIKSTNPKETNISEIIKKGNREGINTLNHKLSPFTAPLIEVFGNNIKLYNIHNINIMNMVFDKDIFSLFFVAFILFPPILYNYIE
jgi:hypothetical protein